MRRLRAALLVPLAAITFVVAGAAAPASAATMTADPVEDTFSQETTVSESALTSGPFAGGEAACTSGHGVGVAVRRCDRAGYRPDFARPPPARLVSYSYDTSANLLAPAADGGQLLRASAGLVADRVATEAAAEGPSVPYSRAHYAVALPIAQPVRPQERLARAEEPLDLRGGDCCTIR
jgi:hypothetical protein